MPAAETSVPRIVGLGGTTRSGSSSERALREALAAAEESGAEVVFLGAGEIELPMYAPERPGRTAEAERLVRELRAADGVIIASPGYHGGLSGLVKNALDYTEDMRDDERPYLDGRAVGCIACAAGWQAVTTTLVSLRSVVHALRGWPTPLGVGINTTSPDRSGDPVAADKVRDQLHELGRQVVKFAHWQAPRA